MYLLVDFFFSPGWLLPSLLINFSILLMVTPLHINSTTALQHYCHSLIHVHVPLALAIAFIDC